MLILEKTYSSLKEIIVSFYGLDGFYISIFLFLFLPLLAVRSYYFISIRYYGKYAFAFELFEISLTWLFLYDIFIGLFSLTDFKTWCFLLNVQLTFIYGVPIIIFEFKEYWKRTPFFIKFFHIIIFLIIIFFILIRINSNINSI